MPKKTKNPAAVLLGQLSGLKRGGPPNEKLLRLTKERKHAAAVALGKLGGLKGGVEGGKKGGVARAKKLSASVRREIASRAASIRWAKKRNLTI